MTDLPLGAFIQTRRIERGVSQRQLSINAGLSTSYVSKVESGTLEPSLRAFAALAHELAFTSAEIVFLVKHEHVRDVSGSGHDRRVERDT